MIIKLHPTLIGSALMGVCLTVAASIAVAGEIKLSTVRIDLADRQPTAAVTLTNTSAEKTIVHLRALSWSQSSGKDATDPTNDLIINPPIAEIEPGAKQLLRIGYSGKLQTANERTYRLSIEEVPRRDRERQQVVETYLKISIPIFIAPLSTPERRLSAALSHADPAGILLRNDGSTHVRLVSYTLTNGGSPHQGLFYVLPGARITLPLEPKERLVSASGTLDILTDEGPLKLQLQPSSE